ncbi:uncharacterized protein LOC134784410 [Penaeus indicus]|uniref:uncharacterized protein LOC134784410 n=1 Tax=Penaeus indicus TaxID=29960 RepID=UPI00300C1E78
MRQQEKLKGTQRNGKNTKHKPQESQPDDSDEYSKSEESDEVTSFDESDGEEEQSSERSVEDEEEEQSSERSVEDEEQSSEGSDCAGYEYTTDEEDNDPSGEQDSESDEEDKEGSESSEESSRQPEQQGPKEQRSKQNPKESRRKKDLGNQTQLHKRERKKSQGKTPSPAKPAEKLRTNQDIPRQKGTPPQSTRPAKKPSTSGTATEIRDTRGEKGKTKQAGKPKQERITKRPKSGETRDPRVFSKEDCDYSNDNYRTPHKSDIRKENPSRFENRPPDQDELHRQQDFRRGERRAAARGKGTPERDKQDRGRTPQSGRLASEAVARRCQPEARRRRTKDIWLNSAGQVCRDRNTEGQPKSTAHKTRRNLDKCGKKLHAYDLVEIMVQEEDLNSNIREVIRERNVGPEDVQRVLNNNADIFHIKSDGFCLKLKLCTGHLGSKGCKNRRDCIDMHICQNFLKGICRYRSCGLGHNLTTGHNSKVLQKFFLNRLGSDTLLRVLSKNIPKITSNSHKGSADQGIRDSSPDQKPLETSESDVTPPSGDDDESDADCLSGGRVERKKRSPNEKKTHIQSVWSSDSDGDVGIPEICYDSVEGICTRLDIDCERLHSFQHFYWQISRDKSKWFNLHPQLVSCLEKSYCDVSKDGVTLPKLKETDLQSGHTGAVKILSRDEWTSDFQSMTLVNSSHKVCAHLRRLCSQKTASVKANTFRWYYRDDDQKWVPYDNSEEKGQHITNISEEIEKHYLAKPSTPFNVKNQRFNYVLDFQRMFQINAITNKRRDIRRRPLEHLCDTSHRSLSPVDTQNQSLLPVDTQNQSLLPRDWEDMQPKERVRLVDLDPKSKEYRNVIILLGNDTYKAKVQKIQRNQNPYLWKAFQIKKEEMILQYGDEASVKMTDLFHGTKPDIVNTICKENFDFRLHGESTGHIWGKGSYFGNDITFCYRYCRPDSTGLRYLFVAKVLVGAIVLGEKDLRRPPLNTATNNLFDTTVDNETHPTIFVKYDKQEYYPEYIITMA